MTARRIDSTRRFVYAAVLAIPLAACSRHDSGTAGTQAKQGQFNVIERMAFNSRAAEQFLPLLWREDANRNGTLEPDELAILTGFAQSDRAQWIDAQGRFTSSFK